jgi:hypothetical protein
MYPVVDSRWPLVYIELVCNRSLMKQPVKILQSMRAGRFGDLTVLGSQYVDRNRVNHWCCAVWSEQNPDVQTYWISAAELPENLTGRHQEAVLQAIRMWESSSPGLHRT